MRILILLRDGCRNGITTYNRVLAQALHSQGHSVSVWPDPDALPAIALLPDARSYRIRVIGGGSHLHCLGGVARQWMNFWSAHLPDRH